MAALTVLLTAGALLHLHYRTLDVRVAAWFGGLGAVGAMAGARVGRLLPAAWFSRAPSWGSSSRHPAARQ